jgi:hypothetical protein
MSLERRTVSELLIDNGPQAPGWAKDSRAMTRVKAQKAGRFATHTDF